MIYLVVIYIGYVIYGLVHAFKNKEVNYVEKILWIIIIVTFPLGASYYLRSTFIAKH